MSSPFVIKKIAVLGAGVMGAQIAAHCVNAGIETCLFDLASKEGARNALIEQAIAHLSKLKPTPLASALTLSLLQAKNYEENLADLESCDLIIEAIAERLEWKIDLFNTIASFINEKALLVSNTSGLSINTLAQVLSSSLRKRFCGVHFFNPPRYMHLVELIPAKTTSSEILDNLETWLTSYLGKGVVRAKDTPNFIANRIGVASLLITLYHALQMKLGCDEVDAITGVLLGRPKSATFRTMDVVGLDTMHHVVCTMEKELTDDPWHKLFSLPTWLTELIDQGFLGQKKEQGIYRKQGKSIEVFDFEQNEYRLAEGKVNPELKKIMALSSPTERWQALMRSQDKQAKFVVACYRDLFHYCAYHLSAIADNMGDIDLAMRWGFGWEQGPFEIWQLAGIETVRHFIDNAIQAGETISPVKLPAWLKEKTEFYTPNGAFSPLTLTSVQRNQLPVYQRQIFPQRLLQEKSINLPVIVENEGVILREIEENIALLSFKSKANTIDQAVLDGLEQALEVAEQSCQGVIIYQSQRETFSAGADLRSVLALIQAKKFSILEKMITQFQQLMMRVKYSPLPIVAALRGRALGGGCELIMHCDAIVASFESYPGLVEIGVGLLPAGGGCKEFVRRAAHKASYGDLLSFIKPYFEQVVTAQVAISAIDAKQRGFLQEQDSWVMHSEEVLYVALTKIKSLLTANYQPPMKKLFKVAGREGHARLQARLVNWREGGFISEHDYYLANKIADVFCGGNLNQGELVNEAWLLKLEREAFMAFAETPLTSARIAALLETGKPLRN